MIEDVEHVLAPLFVYCYGRIVVVMRRQMRVMAGHNAGGNAQANASQIQSKRIKWDCKPNANPNPGPVQFVQKSNGTITLAPTTNEI